MSDKVVKRIGIFSGTFDPVHKGHLAFALQAIEAAGLEKVIFLPEPKPRNKMSVTHVSHRIAMLRLSIRGHKGLEVMELPDKQFTVRQSLPRLRAAYPDDHLLLMVGTDVLAHISVWPMASHLLRTSGLVVAVRGQKDEQHAHRLISDLPVQPPETHVFVSAYKEVSSREIRVAIQTGQQPVGELASIQEYIKENWLYSANPRQVGRRR